MSTPIALGTRTYAETLPGPCQIYRQAYPGEYRRA